MKTDGELATESMVLSNRMAMMLHGRDPSVQSAVLADLLALWLAGHFADGEDETTTLRASLLAQHLQLVGGLIETNEKIILERIRKGSQ